MSVFGYLLMCTCCGFRSGVSCWLFMVVGFCGWVRGWLLCDWRAVLLIGAGLGCWVCCVVVAFG